MIYNLSFVSHILIWRKKKSILFTNLKVFQKEKKFPIRFLGN